MLLLHNYWICGGLQHTCTDRCSVGEHEPGKRVDVNDTIISFKPNSILRRIIDWHTFSKKVKRQLFFVFFFLCFLLRELFFVGLERKKIGTDRAAYKSQNYTDLPKLLKTYIINICSCCDSNANKDKKLLMEFCSRLWTTYHVCRFCNCFRRNYEPC